MRATIKAPTLTVAMALISLFLLPCSGRANPVGLQAPRPAVDHVHADKAASPQGGISSGKPSSAPAMSSNLPIRHEMNIDQISFDTPSLAPMAFMRFCRRYPGDCQIHGLALNPQPVEFTRARMAELVRVNRKVNRAIKPQENLNGVTAEEWRVSPRAGDCNDYAVTKRHELLAHGWPSRSLLLAEVIVPSGEHHLVLVVRSPDEDFVLDNLNSDIRPISRVGYQWVRAQQTKNPKFWSKISVARAAQVAMVSR